MELMTDLINYEPSRFREATQYYLWQEDMVEDYDSIMKHEVWEVVLRPQGKNVVGSRWIYKVKHVTNRSVET